MSVQQPISRTPSNYTPNNGVRQKVHSNPIPSEMIGKCIEEGEIVHKSNDVKIVLRYEQGSQFIELRINLKDSEVYGLTSSYERDWQDAK